MQKLRAAVTALLLLAAVPLCSSAEWLTDFEQAKTLASARQVPILADFSGSDWCGWCIKLDREVFSKPEFLSYAEGRFVLFLADFPSRKTQAPALQKQNRELSDRYNIQGFPTVLLLDAQGKVLGRTGYKPGGPSTYIAHLNDLLK